MQESSQEHSSRFWWQKPGFGIMYQIESRPGWIWERDFDKFNASMKDQNGNLNFNGPFCKIREWVQFSKIVGVNYHIFESKWHDGICYFNTNYTNWKTPVDYCKIFAEESKKEKLPFMFYYSSVFDHNPQFDKIQPVRNITSSFLALHREKKEEVINFCVKFTQFIIKQFIESVKKERKKKKTSKIENMQKDTTNLNINEAIGFINQKLDDHKKYISQFNYDPSSYENYLRNQIIELIENYGPNGMWMDWFMKSAFREGSTNVVLDLMRERYPNVVLAFNNSINEHPDWAHYLSGEAHTVDSAWEQGNRYRHKKQPWELVGPAAKSWFDPSPRPDPFDIARIAIIIIANGGKFCFGIPSQLDGSLYPEPAQQVYQFGKWYKPRQHLLSKAIPMDYKGEIVPGIYVSDKHYGLIGSIYDEHKIIHLINFLGGKGPISLEFASEYWNNISNVKLLPNNIDLRLNRSSNAIQILLPQEFIDPVDTILRIKE